MGMDQPELFPAGALSVSDLTRYLRALLESDEVLQNVWVLGEISNCTRPGSGHIYFTLKDAGASLRAVIWKSNVLRLRFPVENGQAVEAHGYISIYEASGQYQLYVDSLRPAGEGYLYQEFARLKARLEAEGLFDAERKRPIPERPQKIGVVTSPTGAALQDILNTLRARYPLAEVVLAPSAVQGEAAPLELVGALERLARTEKPDVILMARGGGSLEDLWAFNDERVVRAVAGCPLPVITGVGHETDFTLVDFAADLRAPTPTGAAVLATPDKSDLRSELLIAGQDLRGFMTNRLSQERSRWQSTLQRLAHASPLRVVQNNQQRLDELHSRMLLLAGQNLRLRKTGIDAFRRHLESLNPLGILQRGYAILSAEDGSWIGSARQVQQGDTFTVRLADGRFGARATTDPQLNSTTKEG